jgi:hypothetical protein
MKYKQSVVRLLDKADNKAQVALFSINRNESRDVVLKLIEELQESVRQARDYVSQEYDELK